jgi:uncharacterized protein DUF397
MEGGTMSLDAKWRKSTRSGAQGGCVEVRRVDERIEVRDTKDRAGGTQRYTEGAWLAFLDGVKAGEFDL